MTFAKQLSSWFTFFLLLTTATAAWSSPFIIAQHDDSQTLKKCRDVIGAAYRQLGMEFRIISYPGRRALLLANEGKVDADLCRIADIANDYPHLLRVSAAVMSIDIVAVNIKPGFKIHAAVDLKPYHLVSILGMKAAELYFQEHTISYVKSADIALAMIVNKHADFAIVPIQDLPKDTSGLIIHRPPLHSHILYHYVHIRHKDLIPKLEAQIRKINSTVLP